MRNKIARRALRKPTDERRMEIVNAAMRVLALQGARAFTAQGIANSVGLTPGAIYRHFEGMREIAEGILEALANVLGAPTWKANTDPGQRLELFFKSRTLLFAQQPHLSLLLFSEHLVHAGGLELQGRLSMLRASERSRVTECLRGQRSTYRATKREETQVFMVLAALAEFGRQAATHLEGGGKLTVSPTNLWAALKEVLQIETPKRKPK